jgi:hypothetical protein
MNDTTKLHCELCHTEMSCERPAGGAMRYFHCAGCGRWVASNYGEELLRAHTARDESSPPEPAPQDLGRIKEHLARWLDRLDESDPYYVLGVPPSTSEERVRERFHELALESHPDRGGDPAQMRKLIAAYDRVRSGKRLSSPPAPVSVGTSARPAARVANRRRG